MTSIHGKVMTWDSTSPGNWILRVTDLAGQDMGALSRSRSEAVAA